MSSGKPMSKEKIIRILKKYKAGMPLSKISSRERVSEAYVYILARKIGLKRPRVRGEQFDWAAIKAVVNAPEPRKGSRVAK